MGDPNPGQSKRQSLESSHPDPDNISVECPYCEQTAKYGLLRDRSQDEFKKWCCPHCDQFIAREAISKLENALRVYGWLADDPLRAQWHADANEALRSLQTLTASAAASPAVLSNQTNPFEQGSQSHLLAPPKPTALRARVRSVEQISQDRGVSSDASSDALYMKRNHTPFESPSLRAVGSHGISHEENQDIGGPFMQGAQNASTSSGESDEVIRGRGFDGTRDIAGPSRGTGTSAAGAVAGSSSSTGYANTNTPYVSHSGFAIVSEDPTKQYLMSGARSPGTSPEREATENRGRTRFEGGEMAGSAGAEGGGTASGAKLEESGDTGSGGSRHSSVSHGSAAVFSDEGSEK